MDPATCQGGRSSSGGENRGTDERKKAEESETESFQVSETGEKNFVENGGYSTPRAPRFRIPEKLPCPPAPKKRRLAGPAHCSARRPPASAVAFFTHPDMELFFLLAGRSGS